MSVKIPSLPNELSVTERTLVTKIIQNYPELDFQCGKRFAFRPPRKIILGPYEKFYTLLLCHEIGHALTKEFSFQTDLERLKIERHAWEQAKQIAQHFEIPIDNDFIEDQLDSYRDWLHNKSLCPHCQLTRYQKPSGQYVCPRCNTLQKNTP